MRRVYGGDWANMVLDGFLHPLSDLPLSWPPARAEKKKLRVRCPAPGAEKKVEGQMVPKSFFLRGAVLPKYHLLGTLLHMGP